MKERYVDPLAELGGLLLKVEKPGRYAGGEFGTLLSRNDTAEKKEFRTLIAFPDLYEIGMGNQALRIIYNRLNGIDGISCDRAFAPAPDFEKLLRETNTPLYGLDTGISLASLDMLMFTLGYELGLNGVLLMMDVSGIPVRCSDRSDEHPVVLAGGPAVSNPLPYSPFIDAFWIGEAEAGFFELAEELALIKKRGQGRAALLKKLSEHPNVWVKGKEKTLRAIYKGFADAQSHVFPIPSMKTVHHHGTVEIMRGCPNGCRFCHAGYWYRPMRQKSIEQIENEVREMTEAGGWQEISLSSLSSGDYCGIEQLVETLNGRFSKQHISFQLPSLKVSGFSLDLLKKISVTRKSGLTFAVETPLQAWQMAVNKEVTRDSVCAILEEAKKSGWKSAKFYFMIGLPKPFFPGQEPDLPASEKSEEQEIVDFMVGISKRTRMKFNVNVGIFIPKPHTPYQWATQIESNEAQRKMQFIRAKLKPLGHKVSISDPLISQIEGLLSRGDENAGVLCEEAYNAGSRLDAWDEYINREKWQEIFNSNKVKIKKIFSGTGSEHEKIGLPGEVLPWEVIDSCVSREYLLKELENSKNGKRTSECSPECVKCGVCGKDTSIIKNQNKSVNLNNNKVNEIQSEKKSDPGIYRILFSFSKRNSAVFHGHLSLIEIFSMSFRRAQVPVLYTQGFNPLAKIEFASPLAVGISSEQEIAAVDFIFDFPAQKFLEALNINLPKGIRIENSECFYIKGGAKKHSLSSLLWGFSYISKDSQIDFVNHLMDKVYKQQRLENDCRSFLDLRRKGVYARNITGNTESEHMSYFDAYRKLYSACW